DVSAICIFLPLAFIFGALGTNVFSSLFNECFFTWPACIFIAFFGAALTTGKLHKRWQSGLVIAGFLATLYLYYEACRSVGMFVAWSFLIGFPFAFPFTALAVRGKRRN